ncbi:hypothetical protein BLOT_004935 [Blomia tropicalis]|nr:hypothetical protein BLOT_004935 [Blomia tropicalis]
MIKEPLLTLPIGGIRYVETVICHNTKESWQESVNHTKACFGLVVEVTMMAVVAKRHSTIIGEDIETIERPLPISKESERYNCQTTTTFTDRRLQPGFVDKTYVCSHHHQHHQKYAKVSISGTMLSTSSMVRISITSSMEPTITSLTSRPTSIRTDGLSNRLSTRHNLSCQWKPCTRHNINYNSCQLHSPLVACFNHTRLDPLFDQQVVHNNINNKMIQMATSNTTDESVTDGQVDRFRSISAIPSISSKNKCLVTLLSMPVSIIIAVLLGSTDHLKRTSYLCTFLVTLLFLTSISSINAQSSSSSSIMPNEATINYHSKLHSKSSVDLNLHRHHHRSHPHYQGDPNSVKQLAESQPYNLYGSAPILQPYPQHFGIMQSDQPIYYGGRANRESNPSSSSSSSSSSSTYSDRSVRRIIGSDAPKPQHLHSSHLSSPPSRPYYHQLIGVYHQPQESYHPRNVIESNNQIVHQSNGAQSITNHMLTCPDGPPSQWESHLDVSGKAFLSPVVFLVNWCHCPRIMLDELAQRFV